MPAQIGQDAVTLQRGIVFGGFKDALALFFRGGAHIGGGFLGAGGRLGDALVGLGLRLSNNFRRFFFRVGARLGGHARIFQTLRNLLLTILQGGDDRLVNPAGHDKHDQQEIQHKDEEKARINT